VIDEGLDMALELAGKQVIAIGERDGVPGGALSACARAAGASVLLEVTHCFV
jgi:betaine reductase